MMKVETSTTMHDEQMKEVLTWHRLRLASVMLELREMKIEAVRAPVLFLMM